MIRHAILTALLVFIGFVNSTRADEDEPKGGPDVFKKLAYRSIGPAAGGRITRAAGVAGDPLVYYAATASGGVWKSSDGGIKWKPIFDEQPTSTAGSLAIAPSDPNVIYVGSGEANIRGNVTPGNGIYKSTDAGKTWKQVWKQEGQIGTMIVHPTNPEIAFAAVLGHAFGPNPERGVFRTIDGGKSWKNVLSKDSDTGASDVCFDPSNPHVLFAGLWQTRRRPWELTSGGPGSGLYVSRDGGDTWKQLTGKGLPEGTWGKVGVAVAPSDGRRVYALIEADKGGLFRSDDGGDSWKLVNAGKYLRQRAWYYTTLTIDPKNPDIVWAPNVRMLKSIDGGKTFKQATGFHHGDHHDLWIDPLNPKRMIDSNDGGVDITTNNGETWYAPALPISQFYHINVDQRHPYHVSGTMQDLGTASGPSNSLASSGIALSDWYHIGGGETGFTAPDPTDPNIVYAGEYGGYISRYDYRTKQARNVSIYPTNPSGHGADSLRYRFQWTAPILISPHDPKIIYHAANVLFRSTDAGMHWNAISKDLTRNDRTKQGWSGGPITGDNTGAEYYCTIFAIAESPKEKGVLWAGSDDGLVHVSRDGGKNWINVTKQIPGIPEWGTVACIEASPFEAGTAYVVIDAHRMDDMHPYLYKTTDYGSTWKSLTARLPADDYLHAVREDPKRKGLLFLGTEHGVRFSADDGVTWEELKLNLPTVAVHDLLIKNNDLVVGTNGRSIWIFDDLTPLRELTPDARKEDVRLFPVTPAVRWRYHSAYHSRNDKFSGDNPPHGAVIQYFLKSKAHDPITIDILDAQGQRIRTLKKETDDDLPADDPDGPAEPPKKKSPTGDTGVQRFTWDLQHEGPKYLKKVKVEGDPKNGPLVLPGTFTIRLNVDGKTYSQKLEVLPDPRVSMSGEEFAQQEKLTLQLRDEISRLTGIVERIRSIRSQLKNQLEALQGDTKAVEAMKAAKILINKLDTLEAKLHNPKAEVTYDILAQRGGAKLYSKMSTLYDWLKDSDGPITQGTREVYEEQSQELQALEREWKILADELTKYNELRRKLEIPHVIVPSK